MRLGREEYRDRVYACWLGKNCGGTLGEPLERAFGEPEPLDVWWYPELREGGLPNDDLEMQLIWLKAIEERGFDIDAKDLAQYWLDHIGYNFDEYGRSKSNLRLGLLPPVSGAHNNGFFADCMGSPIRSEIWACLAPGVPEIAVRYAYEDAICDHAGGEGVFGELFNAAVESAAFLVHDRDELLDLGLGYIPEGCRTARAIRTAREAHAAGLGWKEARRKVLEATPHYVAQYAPINLGFQTIGWLYGEDFGDAICKAVNCGYDTDCTGATLGSILGIIAGTAGLPSKWTDPLGVGIATNESWGGIRHASDGLNPVPATLDELTDRVCALGERLLTLREAPVLIGETTEPNGIGVGDLRATASVESLWSADPMRIIYNLPAASVTLDYVDTPAVRAGQHKALRVKLDNTRPDSLVVSTMVRFPEGWSVEPADAVMTEIEAGEIAELDFEVRVPEGAHLRNSNRGTLSIQAHGRPAQPLVPIVLLAARPWQICGPFAAGADEAEQLLATPFEPEENLGDSGGSGWRKDSEQRWRSVHCLEDALAPAFGFAGRGVWYARAFLRSPQGRTVRIGVPANCPTKLWLNGEPLIEFGSAKLVRPDYDGHPSGNAEDSRKDAQLSAGWNEVLIKFVRGASAEPFEAYFVTSYPPMFDGTTEIEQTAFPWEGAAGKPESKARRPS